MQKKILSVLLIIGIMTTANASTLTQKQIKILKTVHDVCSQYHATDGMSFGKTCSAITLQESSAGKNIIGDQGIDPDILVNSSLGVMQIRVRTVLEVLEHNKKLRKQYKYFWHKDYDAIHKYVPILIAIKYYYKMWRQSRGRRAIEYHKKYILEKKHFIRYKKAYNKDLAIAESLLTDIKFSATIAANYLILNYELAQKRHYWNPWWKAVSRYNGGWKNVHYAHGVILYLDYLNRTLYRR